MTRIARIFSNIRVIRAIRGSFLPTWHGGNDLTLLRRLLKMVPGQGT
jgi:hypothetical protein